MELLETTKKENELINKNYKLKLLQIDNGSNSITIWFWRLRRSDKTKYHSRCISFSWLRKVWKINKVKPMYKITNNGAKRIKKDSCYDMSIYIGYFIFGYTNWSYSI